MDGDSVARWLIVAALVFFCALISCAQAALTTVNEGRLRDSSARTTAQTVSPPEMIIFLCFVSHTG